MPDIKTKNQKLAFDFLLERFQSQDTFTRLDFFDAIPGWSASSRRTYWSKQIKHFLIDIGRGRYRVTEAFRPYATWSSFRKHIATQVRRTYSDYTALTYDNLIVCLAIRSSYSA